MSLGALVTFLRKYDFFMAIVVLQKRRQNCLPQKSALTKKLSEPQKDCICFKVSNSEL